MKSENSVVLSGPISRVQWRPFDNFGFLSFDLNRIKVSVTLNARDFDMADVASRSQYAVVSNGYFDSRQDRNDPSKVWYSIGARPSGVLFLNSPIPTDSMQNYAYASGRCIAINDEWIGLACAYHVPGRDGRQSTWKERTIRVHAEVVHDISVDDKCFVAGRVEPMFNGVWHLHLRANAVHKA